MWKCVEFAFNSFYACSGDFYGNEKCIFYLPFSFNGESNILNQGSVLPLDTCGDLTDFSVNCAHAFEHKMCLLTSNSLHIAAMKPFNSGPSEPFHFDFKPCFPMSPFGSRESIFLHLKPQRYSLNFPFQHLQVECFYSQF